MGLPPPPREGPLQFSRKSSKLTLSRRGGETRFYGQNDFMDIWAFLRKWGSTKYRCIPKCERHWRDESQSVRLPRKSLQGKGSGAPTFFLRDLSLVRGPRNSACGKPCPCPRDTCHFRHFRRFTGFEQQRPCFTG